MTSRVAVADESSEQQHTNGVGRVARFAVLVVFSVLPMAGLLPVFESWGFLVPALAGAVAAATVAHLGEVREWTASETLGAWLISFLLVGLVVTAGLPTGGEILAFVQAIVGAWPELLTLVPPVDVSATVAVVPFAISFVACAIGGHLLRGGSTGGLSVASVIAVVLTALMSIGAVGLNLGQGALVGGVVLGVAAVEGLRRPDGSQLLGDRMQESITMRVLGTSGLVVGITVSAVLVAPLIPGVTSGDRFELRDTVEPPWNPLEAPSPLVQLKSSIKDDRRDDVVFTVISGAPIERFVVAVLNAYDGVVWGVASSADGRDGNFQSVGSRLPEFADAWPEANVESHVARITIESLGGNWIPTPGRPVSIEPGDLDDVRFNPATGTLASATTLGQGVTYTVEAETYVVQSDSVLRAATIVPHGESTELKLLPPQVRNLAADLTEGVSSGWPQVEAIRDTFTSTGYYDRSSATRPGHSYARIAEFLNEPDRIVGYEELYAATAGVLARVAELPSRVVVGYVLPPDRWTSQGAEVRAGDISAWIEVRTEEYGWMTVDVTPDESREPTQEDLGVTTRDVATPNPPPPPPPPPERNLPQAPQEPTESTTTTVMDEQLVSPALAAAGIATGTLVSLLLVGFGLIVLLKTRRRERRRTAPEPEIRIIGAWDEILDRFTEAGVPRQSSLTPRETLHLLKIPAMDLENADTARSRAAEAADSSSGELRRLASAVDIATFDPRGPCASDVDQAWAASDLVSVRVIQAQKPFVRLRMKADPRPLMTPDPSRRARIGRRHE